MVSQSNTTFSIFTVCNLAYLPKALVLAESVLKYNNVKLKVFIFDTKKQIDVPSSDVDLYWVEDLDIPNFKELAFKYDIIEFSTSLKPLITLHLLESYYKVIFLDPDTCLFDSVQSILDDLDRGSVVLTPHYTTPQSNDLSESDLGMMRFGSFNLGFYAVKKSSEGLSFFRWWSQRCIDFSFMESQFGLSTDQKWVSIAPCFFKDLHISFNLGYNFAPWNSWERIASKDSDGKYWVNGSIPLVFFHFSNFDPLDTQYLNKRSCYEKGVHRPDLLDLGDGYLKSLKEMEHKTLKISSSKYAFDYMSGGEYISPTLRRAYSCILPELPGEHDPFDSSGIVGSFARKNFLFEKNEKVYTRDGFKEVSNHRRQLKFIYVVMRLVLRVVGPNKFQNLSRLLVYLSSYRQNRGLWKY